MVRVKRGTIKKKKRRRLLRKTKGFLWGRKSKYRLAKEALMKAWTHSYRDRKRKKRELRRLWQIQINAFCRNHGLNYSKFIHLLKEKKIALDRKILAQILKEDPKIFEKIIEEIKS